MDDLIQQGANAFKAGDKETARKLLITAVKQNPDNERAWGWMYNVCNTDQERIQCLKQMLRINPKNEKANQLLNQLTGFDFPLDAPLSSVPIGQNVQTINNASAQSSGLDGISIIIIVLLIILGLFWIAIGLVQIAAGSALGSSTADAVCTGGWNIMISIVNLVGISDVVKRSKRVPREMMFLAIVGTLLGGYQLLNGAFIQACAVPLYIVLGILASVNKAVYKN